MDKYLDKNKKNPTPLKIFLFSLGCSVNELFFILTDFFPCEDSQMSLSWVESVVFFNWIGCIKIKGKFPVALHLIIYYFYLTWHLFRRTNSSISIALCEKKGEIRANASKYPSEKHKWTYISSVEVQNSMLGTRSNHKFLYCNKSDTATAATFRGHRSE